MKKHVFESTEYVYVVFTQKGNMQQEVNIIVSSTQYVSIIDMDIIIMQLDAPQSLNLHQDMMLCIAKNTFYPAIWP